MGEVTLPVDSRLLYADRQGVLIVTTDELDVPSVEWWPFVSTGA
jgi:hypothetical protein